MPNAATITRAALTFPACAGCVAGQCVSCWDVGRRGSAWRQRKLLGDAVSPLPDVGPVAEVFIQAAEHQQRGALGAAQNGPVERPR